MYPGVAVVQISKIFLDLSNLSYKLCDTLLSGIEPDPLQLQCAPYTKGIMWAVIQSPPLRNESFSY
jgi:hypothetical protein